MTAAKNWTWGEDGASIFAEVDGAERRIASLPIGAWWDGDRCRDGAKRERKRVAALMAAAPTLLDALFSIQSHRNVETAPAPCGCRTVGDCEAAIDRTLTAAIIAARNLG